MLKMRQEVKSARPAMSAGETLQGVLGRQAYTWGPCGWEGGREGGRGQQWSGREEGRKGERTTFNERAGDTAQS
jgi:hypothetical protein